VYPAYYLLFAFWVAWLLYWIAAAVGVKAVARAESWQSRLAYSLPLWITAFLLFDHHLGALANARFLPWSHGLVWFGVILTAVGLAFAVWARVALGGNWSGQVTVKQEHELIRSGPYALARHPIYTGLSLALLGTAIAVGEWRALAAFVIAVASFWYKIGLEERMMRETFAAEYEDYRRRVKTLIPFVI
jgi:protein-S-isoprenylcysteine O-methyltransferase Ste14